MSTSEVFGAEVVAAVKRGCHLFLECDNGQKIDIPLCDACVNSCGALNDNKFEIVSKGISYVFDPDDGVLDQATAEDYVVSCSCGTVGEGTSVVLDELLAVITVLSEGIAEILLCLQEIKSQTTEPAKNWQPVEQWVSDETSLLCGVRVVLCLLDGVEDGKCYFYDPGTKTYKELPVGILTTPYKPSGDKVCAEAQAGPIELLPGATTIADIVAANLPDPFDFNGTLVPVTADDVSNVVVTPKACGTLNSNGDEITSDFVLIDGIAASQHVDDEDGGVTGTTAVEVPEGGCSVVTLCFKGCLGKQELAALSKREEG